MIRHKYTIAFLVSVFFFGAFAQQPVNLFKPGNRAMQYNHGQWNEKIRYQTFSSGRNISFLDNGLSFAVSKQAELQDDNITTYYNSPEWPTTQTLVYNLVFESCNKALINTVGEKKLHNNYLIGNDVNKYVRSVNEYEQINYKNIYNNINLSYYFKNELLEYDFILYPGANVNDIKLRFDGVNSISVDENNNLLVQTPWGLHIENAPYAYQVVGGIKQRVDVQYALIDRNTFGFKITGDYDKNNTLVIDPVILDWSTYVGGSVGTQCIINDMVVDALGFVYATGFCQTSFPVTVGIYNGGIYDGFVVKMQPNGSGIVWAAYIGGSANDVCNGIAVNSAGEVFVCGTTSSNNFPLTAGAVDNTFTFSMPYNSSDAFVLKLNVAGTAIVYSTFLGGQDAGEGAQCIELSGTNEVVVGGDTRSPDFPVTAGAFDTKCFFAKMDGFISRININPTGGAINPANLLYSTCIGGDSGNESVRDIKFGNGHIYFTGITFQPLPAAADFPITSGALDNTYNADNLMCDGYVSRINPAGMGNSDLVYSTYIGAPATWMGIQQQTMSSGIALSSINPDVVYVTGQAGWGFPTTAVSPGYSGGQGDVFVMKLRMNNNNTAPDITDLLAGRYMGGSAQDSGFDIAVDSDEEIFVTGKGQIDFPITCGAVQTSQSNSDVFVAKLDNNLNILYSTYLGGTAFDFYGAGEGQSIALLGSGCKEEVLVCGSTTSADFPTTAGSYQPVKLNTGAFQNQGFIFKLADKTGVRTPEFTMTQTPTACGASVNFNFVNCSQGNVTTYTGWNPITSWNWTFGDGGTSITQNPTHTYSGAGTYTISLNVGTCPGLVTKTITVTNGINVSVNPASAVICQGNNITLTASGTSTGGAVAYSWSTGIITNTINVSPTSSTTFSVLVTDPSGCTASATSSVTVNPLPSITVTNNGPLCFGSAAQLSATGGASYQWLPAGMVSNPAIAAPITTTLSGTSTFTVLVTDLNGCSATGTTMVQVTPLPDVSFSAPDTSACKSLCVNFMSQSASATSYYWNFGDGTTASSAGATHCYTTSGNYSVSLTVTDANGCKATAVKTNYITIFDSPVAAFIANPQPASLTAPTIYFTNLSSGANVWQWSFGDALASTSSQQNTSFTYDAEGEYTVTLIVINEYGCADTAIDVIEMQQGYALYIANTFTPNDDGLNDVFKPSGISIATEGYEFYIFDRWGNLIFKTNDFNKGWNGKANGGAELAQEDTYVWKINTKSVAGESYRYCGHVNLIR